MLKKILIFYFLIINIDTYADVSNQVNIAFLGDIMMHGPQIKSGYIVKTDNYNFDYFFKNIKNKLEKYDFTIGNLETPVADKKLGLGSYPIFNSPYEILIALKNTGFDILSFANNHSYDKGLKGVLNTIDNISNQNMQIVGEGDKIYKFEKNNIKFAIIACTYGFNIGDNPKGKNIIQKINKEKIGEMILSAKKDVDIVIIMPHWGNEYEKKQNEYQKNLAKFFIEKGADIIIGSHPHVIQPVEKIKVKIKNANNIYIEKEGVVAYSLGNFISNQKDQYTDIGLLLNFIFSKDKNNKVSYNYKKDYIYTYKYYIKGIKKFELYFLNDIPFENDRIKKYKFELISKVI